jgi:2-C-methyl-D-erythritol 2,4-cyclodiphosphate synthase
MMRIGHGFDVHRFSRDRDLILGGMKIPHPVGLLGHSDADVLTHAIMDSLLGAAGARDIGYHFPDSSSLYKGISSITLLEKVVLILDEKGFKINNIDSTVVAEEPRLSKHIESMVNLISKAVGIKVSQVNIKATTSEGLGFTGRREGIAAFAVSTIQLI